MTGTSGPRPAPELPQRRAGLRGEAVDVDRDGVRPCLRHPVGERRGVLRPDRGAQRHAEARGGHGPERRVPRRFPCDDEQAPSAEVLAGEGQQRTDDARVRRREAREVLRADAIHGVERVGCAGADHGHRPARRRGEPLQLGERAEGIAGADDAEDARRRRVARGVPRAPQLGRPAALVGVRAGLVADRVPAGPPPARRQHRTDRVGHRARAARGRAGQRQVRDDEELRLLDARPVLRRGAGRALDVHMTGVGLAGRSCCGPSSSRRSASRRSPRRARQLRPTPAGRRGPWRGRSRSASPRRRGPASTRYRRRRPGRPRGAGPGAPRAARVPPRRRARSCRPPTTRPTRRRRPRRWRARPRLRRDRRRR